MSFLSKVRGYEYFEKKVEPEVDREMASRVRRFYLPAEAETTIIFLDDYPPILEEHQLQINGDWRNWFTCRKVVDEHCPLCAAQYRQDTVGFWTVIDESEWTNDDGEVIKNQRKLFPAKYSVIKQLRKASQRLREEGFKDGLKYARFTVRRTSSRAANCGDVFHYEGHLTEEELLKLVGDPELIQPFDYEQILAPKSIAELEAVLASQRAEQGSSEFSDEDDVEF